MATEILIIDDETGVRDLMAVYLKRLGYTIVTAADGRSGLDVVNAQLERSLHKLREDKTAGRNIQFTLLPEEHVTFGGLATARPR